MSIISLITDFGLKDNFAGVMKAVILGINPSALLVDICHGVKPQDIAEAAFLLKTSFRYFPSGTVHLVVVDPDVGLKRRQLLVRTEKYFFIAPDNGVLAFALKDEPPIKIIQISNEKYFLKPVSDTFAGRDIFAPVAAYITRGEDINKFGRRINNFKELELPQAEQGAKGLTGEIIYIDRFGNLVSNIGKSALEGFILKAKKFKISIKGRTIGRLSHSYSEGAPLRPLALIDSFGYLEIAVKGGSAGELLRIKKGAKIKVEIC